MTGQFRKIRGLYRNSRRISKSQNSFQWLGASQAVWWSSKPPLTTAIGSAQDILAKEMALNTNYLLVVSLASPISASDRKQLLNCRRHCFTRASFTVSPLLSESASHQLCHFVSSPSFTLCDDSPLITPGIQINVNHATESHSTTNFVIGLVWHLCYPSLFLNRWKKSRGDGKS